MAVWVRGLCRMIVMRASTLFSEAELLSSICFQMEFAPGSSPAELPTFTAS